MKKKLFKIRLLENDYVLNTLAEELGINRDTLSRWIKKDTYPLWAVKKTAKILNLSDEDILDIFIREEN